MLPSEARQSEVRPFRVWPAALLVQHQSYKKNGLVPLLPLGLAVFAVEALDWREVFGLDLDRLGFVSEIAACGMAGFLTGASIDASG